MTTPVSRILTNVTTALNDAGMVHWTLDELLRWGSEGQVELVKLHPDAKLLTTELPLAAGARQLAPSDCVAVVDIPCVKDGSAVTKCSREPLDRFSPGWLVTPVSATVRHWIPDDVPGVFYVYPAQPPSGQATVLITYGALPAQLTQTGNLDVRDIYAANIENYMLYRAYSKDAEVGANAVAASAYYQAFAA